MIASSSRRNWGIPIDGRNFLGRRRRGSQRQTIAAIIVIVAASIVAVGTIRNHAIRDDVAITSWIIRQFDHFVDRMLSN